MTDTYTEEMPIEPPLSQQLSRVDAPMERRRVGDMTIDKWAGLTFAEYREAIEFSKVMAEAKHSVPKYLQQNRGDCCAVLTQALRWRLEPYWVAQHSYVVKDGAMIAYDSAVHAAILLSSRLLKDRPRYTYAGEGDSRTCTVTATFKGESSPHEYTTPPLKACRKNSPLWVSDPDQQLGYFAIRSWGRRHAPELLGGVYAPDEFDDATQEPDVTPTSPNLLARLPGKMEGAGFQADVVDAGLALQAENIQEEAKAEKKTRKAASGMAAGKPQATAQSVSEPAPTPQPPKPEKPLKEPQTAGEYMDYAAKWIERGTDPDDLEARWEGELDMRGHLKVQLAVRKRLEGMLKSRIATLKVK